jgi:hypothetical protein
VEWLESQERGWRHGDWLTFAVLEQGQGASAYRLAGHVGLKGKAMKLMRGCWWQQVCMIA